MVTRKICPSFIDEFKVVRVTLHRLLHIYGCEKLHKLFDYYVFV